MGKNVEQDNKPNFLKDLNNGILDELTAGGRIKNAVGLAGEVTELEEVSDICGLPFSGYLGKIETPRPSGIIDEVVIAFEKNTPFQYDGMEFDILREFAKGSRLLLSGKVQTLKEFKSGRVLVFVLADFVELSPKAMRQNDVALVGELVFKPRRRETPRGKRITDIFVKVQNELTDGTCYIPCICWQEQADEVAGWQQGDTVELLGRYQSREYRKTTEMIYTVDQLTPTRTTAERKTEIRTAYEVSVQQIRRKEEAENGK